MKENIRQRTIILLILFIIGLVMGSFGNWYYLILLFLFGGYLIYYVYFLDKNKFLEEKIGKVLFILGWVGFFIIIGSPFSGLDNVLSYTFVSEVTPEDITIKDIKIENVIFCEKPSPTCPAPYKYEILGKVILELETDRNDLFCKIFDERKHEVGGGDLNFGENRINFHILVEDYWFLDNEQKIKICIGPQSHIHDYNYYRKIIEDDKNLCINKFFYIPEDLYKHYRKY